MVALGGINNLNVFGLLCSDVSYCFSLGRRCVAILYHNFLNLDKSPHILTCSVPFLGCPYMQMVQPVVISHKMGLHIPEA